MRVMRRTDGYGHCQDPKLESGVSVSLRGVTVAVDSVIFDDNHKAIRVAADQDHGIRPLDPSGR